MVTIHCCLPMKYPFDSGPNLTQKWDVDSHHDFGTDTSELLPSSSVGGIVMWQNSAVHLFLPVSETGVFDNSFVFDLSF